MATNKPKSKPSGTDSVSKKQSFQEWAMAGGGVPLQYKGREHVWDRKVKQYAEGGGVDMAGGGIAKLFKGLKGLKGTQEVLPAAQREVNLAKAMEASKAPKVVYHGTNQDIRSFDKARLGENTRAKSAKAFYFTENPQEANEYAMMAGRRQIADAASVEKQGKLLRQQIKQAEAQRNWDRAEGLYLKLEDLELGAINAEPSGQNIMPAHLMVDKVKTLDMKDSFDADMIAAEIAKARQEGLDAIKLENVYDPVGDRPDAFSTNQWIVFDPNRVKSAIGNRGTYDMSDPDLNKAGGGDVHMQVGGVARFLKGVKGPQDEALRLAQQRAALPPAKGGLGLPPDNTPEQRARAIGFDTPAVHFSRHGVDADTLDSGKFAIAPFDAVGTHVGSKKAARERFDNTVGYKINNPQYANDEIKGSSYPVVIKNKRQLLDSAGKPSSENALSTKFSESADYGNLRESNAKLRQELFSDYDSIPYINDVEAAGSVSYIVPPENIRSRFAAFDPFRKDVATAAAMGVAAPNLLAKEKKKAHGGDVHMDKGGAAFGTFPQMKPRRANQDREAAKNVPVDLARGFVSGVLGAPGDIESFARLPYELITGKDSPTFLPTSEDIEKRLPFRSDTPVGRAASGAGQLAGGFYMGPGSPLKVAGALPGAIKHGAQEFAMASTKGIPKMFIGPKAKTWDQAKADAAARLEKQGVDPVEIWRQTGTFRGADGIPRQEISDAGAVFRDSKQLKEFGQEKKAEAQALKERMATPVGQKDMFPKALTEAKKSTREQVKTLKDEAEEVLLDADRYGQRAKFALEHPELYKAYPELADVPVFQGTRGASGERASLTGNKSYMQMDITPEGLRHNPRSSVLHEMQHAVQNLEDMAPGGSPQMAYGDPRALKILEEMRQMASKPMSFEDYTQRFDHLSDPQKGYEDYVKSIPKVVKDLDRDLQSKAAMEYYKRLAGEAEARATQAREPMSASQRSKEFPYSSYDVLPEDLIVKDAKGSMASMQMGPSDYRSINTGDRLGDLTVGEEISNTGSISASGISNVLPGVRAVPMSSFEVTAPRDLFYAADDIDRTTKLAEQIKQSGRIDPMIVGVDEKGNYIIEGAHRLGALNLLGAKEFPALIAVEDGVKGFAHGGPVKMAGGGAIKEALKKLLKKERVEHPLVFPRAEPKGKEDIRPIAQRMAEQMTGDFVRQNPKVTTNVAGKSRKQFEREKSIPLVTRNVVPERDVPPIDYEKFKDYAMVGVPGDPSLGGVAKRGSLTENTKPTVELTQVGDITPDQPVPLFGGPRFGGDEAFWASNLEAASLVQRSVNALSELYDVPVLGKYTKMGADSANFALHNLDSLLAIQRPERLDPRKMEQLNELIRKGSAHLGDFPNFKGFEDPIDVLLQSQLDSKLRKHIAETLTKPTITDTLGLPNGLDVVAAITHPQLRNLETGVSGFSVGKMTPGAVLQRGGSGHPTYDTNIPGELIGQNKYPTPYEIAFPDTTAYARSQHKPGVQEFNMMKLLGPRERIDQQYIDEMKMYEELMKQYTGRKKGGAVSGLSTVNKLCGCHD
jgi:hypothetical protein